ncbi:MAG: hypothetical protein QM790_10920 [Nibricoccus sp.]
MKKFVLALAAMSILGASALFAGEACKKCSGADKDAACTCKCDKDKGSCPKDGKDSKDAKPASEKKS